MAQYKIIITEVEYVVYVFYQLNRIFLHIYSLTSLPILILGLYRVKFHIVPAK